MTLKLERKILFYALINFLCILLTYILTKMFLMENIEENHARFIIYLFWIASDTDKTLIIMYQPILVYLIGMIIFGISIKKFIFISITSIFLYAICYIVFLYLVSSASGLN